MLEKAIRIASIAHKNQKDKNGKPYILHPLRVMLSFESYDEKIVAVLHDVIEDSNFTLKDLKEEGFSKEIIEAIDAISRREEEEYFEFIKRVITNKMASRVKLKDLADNMNISRIENPKAEDFNRIKKYKKAEKMIKEVYDKKK